MKPKSTSTGVRKSCHHCHFNLKIHHHKANGAVREGKLGPAVFAERLYGMTLKAGNMGLE